MRVPCLLGERDGRLPGTPVTPGQAPHPVRPATVLSPGHPGGGVGARGGLDEQRSTSDGAESLPRLPRPIRHAPADQRGKIEPVRARVNAT